MKLLLNLVLLMFLNCNDLVSFSCIYICFLLLFFLVICLITDFMFMVVISVACADRIVFHFISCHL
jgi:hypothetical protein